MISIRRRWGLSGEPVRPRAVHEKENMVSSRKLFVALILGVVLAWAAPATAASTLTRIGAHPFCRPPLTSAEEVRTLAQKRGPDLQKGFAAAGYGDLYPEFQRQVATAQVDEVMVQPGQKMYWMLFRRQGKGPVVVTKDVTWGGKEPFAAYRLFIDKDGERHEIIVPKGCGNFALLSVAKLPPAKSPPKPVEMGCFVTLSAQEARCGEKITAKVNASGRNGQVTGVQLSILDPAGRAVWQKSYTQSQFEQELTMPCEADSYRVVAVVTGQGDQGQPASGECSQSVVVARRFGGPVVDLGYAHIFDPADYIFGRVGYEIPLPWVDGLHLLGMIGGFAKVDGAANSSAFVADLTLNYHWLGPLSFGFGLGYWSGGDGQMDLIANLGCKVFDDILGTKGELFIEGRSEADQLDELSARGRWGAGLRLRF